MLYIYYNYFALIIVVFWHNYYRHYFSIFFLLLLSLLSVLLFAVIYIIEIKARTFELSYLKIDSFKMLILTRSKARTGQPPGRVASPGESLSNLPRRLYETQQGKAVMTDSAEIRCPSISESTSNGDHQIAGSRISKCIHKRCLTLACYFQTNIYPSCMISFNLKCILDYLQEFRERRTLGY